MSDAHRSDIDVNHEFLADPNRSGRASRLLAVPIALSSVLGIGMATEVSAHASSSASVEHAGSANETKGKIGNYTKKQFNKAIQMWYDEATNGWNPEGKGGLNYPVSSNEDQPNLLELSVAIRDQVLVDIGEIESGLGTKSRPDVPEERVLKGTFYVGDEYEQTTFKVKDPYIFGWYADEASGKNVYTNFAEDPKNEYYGIVFQDPDGNWTSMLLQTEGFGFSPEDWKLKGLITQDGEPMIEAADLSVRYGQSVPYSNIEKDAKKELKSDPSQVLTSMHELLGVLPNNLS